MPKMLQVRNVPDDVHERLTKRAAAAGMSLSEFVGRELKRIADAPTLDEIGRRVERRGTRISPRDAADLIRAERDRRS